MFCNDSLQSFNIPSVSGIVSTAASTGSTFSGLYDSAIIQVLGNDAVQSSAINFLFRPFKFHYFYFLYDAFFYFFLFSSVILLKILRLLYHLLSSSFSFHFFIFLSIYYSNFCYWSNFAFVFIFFILFCKGFSTSVVISNFCYY